MEVSAEVNTILRCQYGLGLGQVTSALITVGDEVMASM